MLKVPMKTKRQFVLYGVLSLVLIFSGLLTYKYLSYRVLQPIRTNMHSTSEMHFEVAKTDEAKKRGLGGRESIPENYGMLFVFSTLGTYGFWMKDMLIPIDIIWLSDTGEILGIEENASPDSYPKVFYPPVSVPYVLETRAGESERKGWEIGTVISLPYEL